MQARCLSVAMADRQIDILAREIHVVQRGAHPQIDVWMRFSEAAQAMDKPFGSKLGDVLTVSAPAFWRCNNRSVPLAMYECVAHDAQIGETGFCDDQPLALAIEELEAQLRFKCLHLVAHGALRDAQLLGRSCEAFMARRSLEGLEGVQRWQAPRHDQTS